jgi:hypothetical protein
MEAKCTRRNEQNGGEQQNSLGWNERNGKQGDFEDREEWRLKAIRLFSTSEKCGQRRKAHFLWKRKEESGGNVPQCSVGMALAD